MMFQYPLPMFRKVLEDVELAVTRAIPGARLFAFGHLGDGKHPLQRVAADRCRHGRVPRAVGRSQLNR